MEKDEIIYGRHPVLELLRSERAVNKIYLAQEVRQRDRRELMRLAAERNVPVQEVKGEWLTRLTGTPDHQGMAALPAPFPYVEVEDLLAVAAERGEPPFLLMLAGVEDPRNLGAILRTADACAVHGVIIPKRRGAALTPAAVKASAGGAAHVPVSRVTNLARCVEDLKEAGLWVVGAEREGEQSFWDADFNRPLLVIIGGEDRGIGRLLAEKCDYLVSIPMWGKVNSLNASVAAALIMYEVRRQRQQVWGQ